MDYLKGDYQVVPRLVRELAPSESILPATPDTPPAAHGGHWVGWFFIQTLRWNVLFAVWQDYKRRGFYVVSETKNEVQTVPGRSLDDLVDGLERLAHEVS